jgi:hypothetical protein
MSGAMSHIQRFIELPLKILSVLFAAGLPLLAVVGLAFPWKVADNALTNHRDSSRLLLGFTYTSSGSDETVAHTYAILPSAFYTLETIKVVKHGEMVSVRAEPYGFAIRLVTFVASMVGMWWFFFRGSRKTSPHASG